MVGFVTLMIFFLTGGPPITNSNFFSSFHNLRESNSLFLHLFPPMWFTGFYEILIGNSSSFFKPFLNYAALSVVICVIAFFLLAIIGYKRQLRIQDEVKKTRGKILKLKISLANIFNSIFLRNPVQRAVFNFFGKSLIRSVYHRMRLATYLAISSALILIVLGSQMRNPKIFFQVNKTLLSIPLILALFLLVGLRGIVKVPISLEANWIFRLTEERDKKHYHLALRKAIFFVILLPLFLSIFVFYSFLWGWEIALLHCLFGLVVSTVVMEALFLNFHKIPFACSYLPGKEKLHIYWLIYLMGSLIYVFLMSAVEFGLLKRPVGFLIFYGVVLSFFLGIRIYQNSFLYRKKKIIYEERPEPVMIGFVSES
jgi:hypothetical protein